MIDKLVSSSTINLLERSLNFTEQRHDLILENIANASTPGYIQKDVSVRDFRQAMRQAVETRRAAFNGEFTPESTDTVEFSPSSSSVKIHPQPVVRNSAFHDGGIRSMEDLMSQLADNATSHNTLAQLLKNKYDSLQKAITMKV